MEGHARVTQTVGGTKLFCGAMDSAFRGPLSRPVALGIIAEEGYSHYLTDGGKGNFTCSKWWLVQNVQNVQKWWKLVENLFKMVADSHFQRAKMELSQTANE